MKFQDLNGNRYGRLVVTHVHKLINKVYHFYCLCDCGKDALVSRGALQQGLTQSCGCLRNEKSVERSTTHGMSKTKVYKVWSELVNRATNPDHPNAEYYVSKGIGVCDKWLKFEGFYEDMGEPPSGKWIERIDNNLSYSKENCKWETPSRQCSNRGRKTNTSGRLGVYFDSAVGKWRALIKVSGIRVDCGRFLMFEDACDAIEKAELKHLGYSRAEGFVKKEI